MGLLEPRVLQSPDSNLFICIQFCRDCYSEIQVSFCLKKSHPDSRETFTFIAADSAGGFSVASCDAFRGQMVPSSGAPE